MVVPVSARLRRPGGGDLLTFASLGIAPDALLVFLPSAGLGLLPLALGRTGLREANCDAAGDSKMAGADWAGKRAAIGEV